MVVGFLGKYIDRPSVLERRAAMSPSSFLLKLAICMDVVVHPIHLLEIPNRLQGLGGERLPVLEGM